MKKINQIRKLELYHLLIKHKKLFISIEQNESNNVVAFFISDSLAISLYVDHYKAWNRDEWENWRALRCIEEIISDCSLELQKLIYFNLDLFSDYH